MISQRAWRLLRYAEFWDRVCTWQLMGGNNGMDVRKARMRKEAYQHASRSRSLEQSAWAVGWSAAVHARHSLAALLVRQRARAGVVLGLYVEGAGRSSTRLQTSKPAASRAMREVSAAKKRQQVSGQVAAPHTQLAAACNKNAQGGQCESLPCVGGARPETIQLRHTLGAFRVCSAASCVRLVRTARPL